MIKKLLLALSIGNGLSKKEENVQGFGTFYGVYLPGVLCMFGVIIYLRFAWIVGVLGLLPTVAVVTLSCFIVFITVLSISSAATNMHVGGGGTYYMVSRSLGIEIGSAIGIPLFIAQTLSVSFCTMGFAESIQPFFPGISITYLGVGTLLALMGLVYFSASIALKTQFLIFLIIVASLVSLFLGKEIQVDETTSTFNEGLKASFWAGFALFFPATTGVESGVSMSGNLLSPRKSLPLGTIAVLLTGFLVYLSIPFFLWSHAPRSLLVSDPLVFQHIAKFQSLIIAGIWAATLSSILSGLLAAPRTLQALALDGVFPKLLAKEWGKTKEPRMATLFCLLIALLGVCFGSIDAIAPILTMFYLIAYATLNLATGLEQVLGNPSWRPTFKVHWIVPISGVLFCLLAMFMIDAGTTILAFCFVGLLYIFMKKRNLSKKWEDILHGFFVFLSRFAIYKIAAHTEPSRTWRPNFLVLSSSPMSVGHLINITSAMSQGKGFLTLASVFSPNVDFDRAERWKKIVNTHLKDHKVEALVEFCMEEHFLIGAKKLLETYGIGPISPNTLVLGEMKYGKGSKEYIELLQSAYMAKKNVMIVREKSPLEKTNKIHIWWDDLSRSNSELMVLISHMLTLNKSYKKSTISLNSVVSSESGKEQRLKYFQDFLSNGRLPLTPCVYIKEKDLSLLEIIPNLSSDADLVLIGMRPIKSDESLDEYEEYYYKMVLETQDIPNVVFVISSEHLDLSDVFT